ncbi:MAG: TIGR00304 family membrane protein [Nanopusillaceae archaeon]|jgi:uncharacterized protein (TIGR00304 family)
MNNILLFLGITFIIIGFSLLILYGILSSENIKYSGIILIGPFPIIIANSLDLLIISIIILFIIIIILFYKIII